MSNSQQNKHISSNSKVKKKLSHRTKTNRQRHTVTRIQVLLAPTKTTQDMRKCGHRGSHLQLCQDTEHVRNVREDRVQNHYIYRDCLTHTHGKFQKTYLQRKLYTLIRMNRGVAQEPFCVMACHFSLTCRSRPTSTVNETKRRCSDVVAETLSRFNSSVWVRGGICSNYYTGDYEFTQFGKCVCQRSSRLFPLAGHALSSHCYKHFNWETHGRSSGSSPCCECLRACTGHWSAQNRPQCRSHGPRPPLHPGDSWRWCRWLRGLGTPLDEAQTWTWASWPERSRRCWWCSAQRD